MAVPFILVWGSNPETISAPEERTFVAGGFAVPIDRDAFARKSFAARMDGGFRLGGSGILTTEEGRDLAREQAEAAAYAAFLHKLAVERDDEEILLEL